MRLIKLALLSFLLLFLLVTVISLFIPSKVRISRALRVGATKEQVMEQVSDPVRWRNWFPDMDSVDMYRENGAVKGIVINRERQRSLRIAEIKENEVVAEYFGIRQKRVTTGWVVMPESASGSVTVQWYMDFKLRWYPWEKFASILFEKQYGPQMEQGLANLEKLLNK